MSSKGGDTEDVWSSDDDDSDGGRDDTCIRRERSRNGLLPENREVRSNMTDTCTYAEVGKVVRVPGGRKMKTNPQLLGGDGGSSNPSPTSKSQKVMKNIVEINSVEEASHVISNLRKLRATNDRQVNTTASTIHNIDAFDRLVVTSNEELQEIVSKGKRMDERLAQSSLLLSQPYHDGDGDDNVNNSGTTLRHERSMRGNHQGEEDFKAALMQRVFDSPTKNGSPGGAKYSSDPFTFHGNNDIGADAKNMHTTNGGITRKQEDKFGLLDGDDDEWSDDEEDIDLEKLRKYNLPPSPSKNDFYDDYTMYDNSCYGSDDEKNVQIEKFTAFKVDTNAKIMNNSMKRNNNVDDAGSNIFRRPVATKDTYVDEVEFSYGDDEGLDSELVFNSSQSSRMLRTTQKKLNGANAVASTTPMKSKKHSMGSGSDKKMTEKVAFNTSTGSRTTMPSNLMSTKGGVIRVRAPGRSKSMR